MEFDLIGEKTEWDKGRKKRKENREGLVQNDCYCRHSSPKSLKTNVGNLGLTLHYLVLFSVRSHEEISISASFQLQGKVERNS